jgi:hypothetical protein
MDISKANQYADDLVGEFKIILQDEDTDCGQEILCTVIAIKSARVAVNRILNIVEYDTPDFEFFKEVLKELDKF